MTEKAVERELERARAQVVRQINRRNSSWAFNGRRFQTKFSFMFNHVYYEVYLINGKTELEVQIDVNHIRGANLNEQAYFAKKTFAGENEFADATEWIAKTMIEVAEKLEDLVELYRSRDEFEQNINRTIQARLQNGNAV